MEPLTVAMDKNNRSPEQQLLWQQLDRVMDPELRQAITQLGMVARAEVSGSAAEVDLKLTIAACPAADRIEQDVRAAALASPGIESVTVTVGVMSPSERQALVTRLKGVRPSAEEKFGPNSLTRVIAVSSGKGGVGKSSITVNLAVALAQQGSRVGLLDADVHGFSIPALIGLSPDGVTEKPTRVDDLILPPVAHDVKTISIGMFLTEEAPVSWRGPMLHRTLKQFLEEVHFGDLDYLVVDLPPGTGDIAISFGQLLPTAEVLVVTTPQESAASIAWRSGQVARQTGQRVIGVAENMSPGIINGQKVSLFGEGGGRRVAARLSESGPAVPLLAEIPFDTALRESGDAGVPLVLSAPDSAAARAITEMAAAIAAMGRGLEGRKLSVSPTEH